MTIQTKRFSTLCLAALMTLTNAMPTMAASKYGEDKPLTSVKISQVMSNEGHKHTRITASNKCYYLLYDSCMDGLIGSVPTNHSSTVTIDGVKYSLRNYSVKNKGVKFASVIKRIGGSSKSGQIPGSRKTPLQKITLNKSAVTLNNGSSYNLTVSYSPANTTDSKTVTWTSSNSKVATVSRGKVTAKMPGTATITAKVGSKTRTCKVTVKAPLTSIALNRTSATLVQGQKLTLSVSYYPSYTTDSKTTTWTSSNNAVATVSGGTITAKKAGSATITAKVGAKRATCTLTVKAKTAAKKESYMNVSQAYTLVNNFRKNKSNQWYWNSDNKTKTKTPGLKALKKDSTLEKIAKLRAKEQWTQYYKNGKLTHTRPNGKSWTTAFPSSMKIKAENLGWGQSTCKQMVLDPDDGWAETNKNYKGQGHRRNMLGKQYTRVGIACYVNNGQTCWAMCLAK